MKSKAALTAQAVSFLIAKVFKAFLLVIVIHFFFLMDALILAFYRDCHICKMPKCWRQRFFFFSLHSEQRAFVFSKNPTNLVFHNKWHLKIGPRSQLAAGALGGEWSFFLRVIFHISWSDTRHLRQFKDDSVFYWNWMSLTQLLFSFCTPSVTRCHVFSFLIGNWLGSAK